MKKLEDDFYDLRNPEKGKARIKDLLSTLESNTEKYLSPWMRISKEGSHVYPSQGLLITPFDHLEYESFQMLPQEKVVLTLRLRRFLLEQFNHPIRIKYLDIANKQDFVAPAKIKSPAMLLAEKDGLTLSIGDIGTAVVGSKRPRKSRNQRYAQGPFVKLGRQARTPFVGSESPDVWNSAPAIATMAASHCLSVIPRNGVTSDQQRQADLASETFKWLDALANEMLKGRSDRRKITKYWKGNVAAALGTNPEKCIKRAELLYKAGVRVFRLYSPEPGSGVVESIKALRKKFGDSVEVFAGQIVDVEQAIRAEEAGADGLYVGIGGGGRCITGVRSGSVVDWPELLWKMRGNISIPVIVQGGASDHVAVTLLLGASGIGVSRVVSGGTIESPGGILFCSDHKGRLFKPYGGEASARTKYTDGKLLPFDIPSFVEGETTKAEMSYVKHVFPTLTYNLHLLTEDVILALVFRGVETIADLQAIDPSPLRRLTSSGQFQQNTH